MRQSRRAKKLVLKQYDSIYKTCHVIAKNWGLKTISLVILKEQLNKHKLIIQDDDLQELTTFKNQFNNTLDKLYKILSDASKRMKSQHISICDIKEGIEVLKNGFEKGFENET